MSLVWTEEDETGLEVLKHLEEKKGKGSLLFNENGSKKYAKFEVLDYYKATQFFYDVFLNQSSEDKKRIEEITGIKFTEIGYGDL